MATAAQVEGAGGVVFDAAGRVLLLTLDKGASVFPKGHLEAGETAVEAALREVEEETGVHATRADPSTFETSYVNPRGVPRRVTWYVMEAGTAEPRVTEPGLGIAAFVPVPQALSLLTHETDRRLLEAVIAARGAAA